MERVGRLILVVLLVVMGVGAVAGAVGLVSAGEELFGEDVLAAVPFAIGYPLAGLALLALVAVPHGVAAVGLWRGAAWGWPLALLAGLLLMTWIFVQVMLVDARFFLQPLCFGWGLVVAVLAAAGQARRA